MICGCGSYDKKVCYEYESHLYVYFLIVKIKFNTAIVRSSFKHKWQKEPFRLWSEVPPTQRLFFFKLRLEFSLPISRATHLLKALLERGEGASQKVEVPLSLVDGLFFT
jgi:hypothetical protein